MKTCNEADVRISAVLYTPLAGVHWPWLFCRYHQCASRWLWFQILGSRQCTDKGPTEGQRHCFGISSEHDWHSCCNRSLLNCTHESMRKVWGNWCQRGIVMLLHRMVLKVRTRRLQLDHVLSSVCRFASCRSAHRSLNQRISYIMSTCAQKELWLYQRFHHARGTR